MIEFEQKEVEWMVEKNLIQQKLDEQIKLNKNLMKSVETNEETNRKQFKMRFFVFFHFSFDSIFIKYL